MDILNSLYTSVFGMSVVFAALVSLILLINLQSLITARLAGRHTKPAIPAIPAIPAAVGLQRAASAAAGDGIRQNSQHLAVALAGSQELKLTGVDEKTAAMIMAIVCDESGIAPDELYFKSIRLLEDQAQGMNEGV